MLCVCAWVSGSCWSVSTGPQINSSKSAGNGEKYRLLSVCIWVNIVHGKNSETPPPSVVLFAHEHKHTVQPSSGILSFFVHTVQVYVVALTFLIGVFFIEPTLLGLCIWVHAGNICAFRGLTHPPQQGVTWAGFIRVPTWSFLDLWGLVKGSKGRKHWEGFVHCSPAVAQCHLCSACSLSLKTACVGATVGLGWWHLDGSPGLLCCVEALH